MYYAQDNNLFHPSTQFKIIRTSETVTLTTVLNSLHIDFIYWKHDNRISVNIMYKYNYILSDRTRYKHDTLNLC